MKFSSIIDFFRKKRDCKLLPHISQPIHGLRSNSFQLYPWAIKILEVENAWKYSYGNNVIVAVIDTGCDKYHEDISANLIDGYNFVENNKDTSDHNGHGTHVAGTIAALNNMLGVVGVSPQTKIMPIKALDDSGMGSNEWVANAIIYAADNGADILTMSLGSEYPSIKLHKAIKYAIKKNVAIFCAAGNSGIYKDINYPAKYPETMSIGAIDRNLDICEFSCSGDMLDFLAPGQDIVSCAPNNSYTSMSGTSMATPFAVGCASLFLSYRRKVSGNPQLRLSKEEYIEHFKKFSLKLKNKKYNGIKKYEANGIIVPVLEDKS
jgi:subtilisin family serine protease